MRLELALPLIAGAASACAQGLNFDTIFAAEPALRDLKPTFTKPIDRAATASSIVSALSAKHAKTKLPNTPTAKPTTKPTAKPEPTTAKVTPSKSISSKARPTPLKVKRDGTCASQNILYGYQPNPNTPTAFLTDTNLLNQALNALPPPGFTKLFAGLSGSMFATNYITYYPLSSYSPLACSQLCAATMGCQSFNLYFERDPQLDPNSANCPNPVAAAAVRCALWGSTITVPQAKNIGEYRADFMVVVTGSNGYSKNTPPPAIAGYSGPTALSGLVNVATINGKSVAAGTGFFPGNVYNPVLCTNLCQNQNAANKAAVTNAGNTTYNACSYADAALLSVNGVAQGTYCALYNDAGVANYATLTQQTYNNVAYDISYSYGYTLLNGDGGLTGITATSASPVASTSTAPASSSASSKSSAPSSTSATTTTTVTPSTVSVRALSAATPTGASCSSLGGGRYTDLNGIVYSTKCGYDLLNVGDIANSHVNSYSDCFTLCDVTAGCDGFAYAESSNTCYMKSLTGVTTVPNANSNINLAWLPSKFTDRSATTSTTLATSAKTSAAATTTGR